MFLEKNTFLISKLFFKPKFLQVIIWNYLKNWEASKIHLKVSIWKLFFKTIILNKRKDDNKIFNRFKMNKINFSKSHVCLKRDYFADFNYLYLMNASYYHTKKISSTKLIFYLKNVPSVSK